MALWQRVSVASALAVLVCACSAPAAAVVQEGAIAHGAKTLSLAGGPLRALPTGTLFIRVIEFRQAAGTSFPSHQHVPGLIYQSDGSQLLAIQDGPQVNIGPSEGYFLGPLAHTHSNPALSANHWYFAALWSTAAKSGPLVSSSAQVAYATPSFPASMFSPGSYVETLRLLTLEPGGRTGAAKFGGIETLYVLDGSVNIHAAGRASAMLAAGDGDYESAGTATQVFNRVSSRSTLLAFYVTPVDQPFETALTQSP